MMKMINRVRRNTKGATAIEYGLIAALIAVAGIGAFTNLGTQVATTFNNASDAMGNVGGK
jgi:pilus assembly protein Flp/PilA